MIFIKLIFTACSLLLTISCLLHTVISAPFNNSSTISKNQQKVSSPSSITSLETLSKIAKCAPLSPRTTGPTSVHDLRIDDIKIVMALGDSITAAWATKGIRERFSWTHPWTILQNIYEYRGLSFAMGGDYGATTLPNMISRFTGSTPYGVSLGEHPSVISWGPINMGHHYNGQDGFNAALSGALSHNIHKEVDWLLERVLNDRTIDLDNDYKLLTVQLGSNDLCLACKSISSTTLLSPDVFEWNVRAALERIRTKIPRVFVNLVGSFNVSQIYETTKDDRWCGLIRSIPFAFLECPCAFALGEWGDGRRRKMDEISVMYNERLERIARDYQRNKSDKSFAVVYDPSTKGLHMKTFPIQYISNVDCFHPSELAQGYFATIIWNNLLKPSSEKKKDLYYDPNIGVECPSDDHRIPTY